MEESKKSQNLSHRQWIDSIILYFTTIKEYEEKIEQLRLALNQQNDFEPKKLFNHLDKNSKNCLSLDDFISFLQDNSINYDEKYLRQFIHNYDKDNDFCINYQEFKGIILPLTDESFAKREEEKENEEKNKIEESNIINKNKEENNKKNIDEEKKEDEEVKEEKKENEEQKEDEINEQKEEEIIEQKEDNKEKEENEGKEEKKDINEEKLDPNILSIFGEILTEEMALAEKNFENAKKCMESKSFTFYECFLEIADEEKFITEENLKNFLTKNGVELNEKEIKGLIHRNDSDNDGKISFVEFQQIFFKSNSNTEYKRPSNNFNKEPNEYSTILRRNPKPYYNYNYNSSYYPSRNYTLKSNYTNNNNYTFKNKYNYEPNIYESDISRNPKLRNTSSNLIYSNSVYGNEDENKYGRNKRYRNSSIINLKNYPKAKYNYENEKENYLLYEKPCCGCPLINYVIHYPNCCCYLCSPCF